MLCALRLRTLAPRSAFVSIFILLAATIFQWASQEGTALAQTVADEPNCSTFPSESLPVIQWCASPKEFTYTIRTWNEVTHLNRRKTTQSIKRTLRNWLANECRTTSLRTRTARVELWLAVPWSGAELAQPRIGLSLDEGNVVFANSWGQPWRAEASNLHILGEKNYEDYSGTSQSGVAPNQVLFQAHTETDDSAIEGKSDELLKEGSGLPLLTPNAEIILNGYGIKPTTVVSQKLGIIKGEVRRYEEVSTIEMFQEDKDFKKYFSWAEPLFRIEHVGDKFLLYAEDLNIWQIPNACLWR
jgi:hypothetical protein